MYFKSSVFVLLAVVSCALAAPKPVSLEEFGRKVREFGQKALPAVRGVCGFVNSYQGFLQNPGFPQNGGYPPVQAYYPQSPRYYPQYPQNFGPVSPNFPPSSNFPTSANFPPTKGQVPSVGASEQDDLNNVFSSTNFGSSQNVPPQIQDVFKNFDKLPKLDIPTVNTIGGESKKLVDWNNSDNNVI